MECSDELVKGLMRPGVLPGAEPSTGPAENHEADSQGPASSATTIPDAAARAQGQSKPRASLADKPGPKAQGGAGKPEGGEVATLAPPHAASSIPRAKTNGHTNGHVDAAAKNFSAMLLARAGLLVKGTDGPNTARSEQFADFQSDAPACDNCGAITVRNGNCYLCHNCGSSMGCS